MITTVFIISLVIVFGMIMARLWEIKRQKALFSSKILVRCDSFVLRRVSSVREFFFEIRRRVLIFLAHHVPHYSRKISVSMKDRVAKKYNALLSSAHGKYVLKNRGTVSTFLKNISEQGGKDGKNYRTFN